MARARGLRPGPAAGLFAALLAAGCQSASSANGAAGGSGTAGGITGAGAKGVAGDRAGSGDAGISGQAESGGSVANAGSSAAGAMSGAGSGGVAGTAAGGQAGGAPLTCTTPAPSSTAFSVDPSGVTFNLGSGKMKLQVCKEDIIRVAYTSASALPNKASLSVSNTWQTPTPFCVSEAAGSVTITTARMKAIVNSTTGLVSYTDLNDKVLLAEDSKSLTPATVEGVSTNKVTTVFKSPSDEALFGLGQHQESVVNYKGKNQHLANSNTQIAIPVLVSNKGYGVFWDNYSNSDFAGGDSSNTKYRYTSEAGDLVDYYFFYGPSLDHVVSLYRTTTGAAPMFSKWAYGLFQSKDHYASSSELLAVKNSYRTNKIPVDVIVQDWDYWDPYAWGSHFMDESRFPDPASLVTQMHSANIHLMISVWPLYQQVNSSKPGEMDNYNALNAINALLPTSGTHHFYDPFNAAARTLVYQQTYDRLLGKYGWDAIWADNTEPQAYPDPVNVHSANTAAGKGALVINAYPLEHNRALYEGWRKVGPDGKRVYILTRSAFAGLQRYGAGVWSGDINSDFGTYVKQVPAGLSYALSGMPYWTTDIGGYFGGSVNWSSAANNELFTRWFQFGAFCPTFRIHGQGARELYNNVWSASTKANLLSADSLRYRLMPYIYSLAAMVTREGYTIMRHLVFDYPDDSQVLDIPDQFMFGPAFLVSPVMTAGASSRSVYFPAGTWYDFWTGATSAGGSKRSVDAPLSHLPLFVRAGSIVPMGPNIQYATESADPLEIRVYRGKDATFTLYEDAGDGYEYEKDQSSRITLTWSESARTLTFAARTGTFPGMIANRTFNVIFVSEGHGAGAEVSATPDQVIKYDGTRAVAMAN
ncbi:MAG TPA: glycoside hydrolase family 31 protein [Polyangiaceae bacterium]|nr:glycoside hydrolase family 31 protein [Polyangiaceae bacterium]